MAYVRIESDQAWAHGRVSTLPHAWAGELLKNWGAKYHPMNAYQANSELREITDLLSTVKIRLDASDSEVVEAANTMAAKCLSMGTLYHQADQLRAAMGRACRAMGIEPPDTKKTTTEGAIGRMTDPLWWRRKLRVQHGRAMERAAIRLGKVNKTRQLYVSDQTVKRREQQIQRNREALENTLATNEDGEEFTLAELAAKGPANKAIRRAELMTRISGFEWIANKLGHVGLFLTITCPSRFHKWRTVGGWRTVENPRFDPSTDPKEAAKYLGQVWARIRAALARQGVKLYGFRVAEPQQDGTPHWHMLVFHDRAHTDTIRAIVRRHALKESPDEPGAHLHRCDFKAMDAARGTAAGYIAKYIAKNIDGYGVEKDLYGNDTITTSARVEAWASTWGIRQFQQIGGAPVGPWRELRRVESVPESGPSHLVHAHRAVNKTTKLEGRENQSVSWGHYVEAQGGVNIGRDYLVRIAKQERTDLKNKYGEPALPVPVGVETWGQETYKPDWVVTNIGATFKRSVYWFVESVRHVWTIARKRAQQIPAKGVSMGSAVADGLGLVSITVREGVANGHGIIKRAARSCREGVGISTGLCEIGGAGLHDPGYGLAC